MAKPDTRAERLKTWFPEVAEHLEKKELARLDALKRYIDEFVLDVNCSEKHRPRLNDERIYPRSYTVADNWIVYSIDDDLGIIFVAGYLEGKIPKDRFKNSNGDTCVNARAVISKDEQEGVEKFLKSHGVVGGELMFLNAPDWDDVQPTPQPQRTLDHY